MLFFFLGSQEVERRTGGHPSAARKERAKQQRRVLHLYLDQPPTVEEVGPDVVEGGYDTPPQPQPQNRIASIGAVPALTTAEVFTGSAPSAGTVTVPYQPKFFEDDDEDDMIALGIL